MEALEFIRTLQKLCTGSKCYDCPLEEKGRCIIIHAVNPEESVRIVEEWAAEQESKKPEQERQNPEQERKKAELHDKTYALREKVDHTPTKEASQTPEQKRTNKDVPAIAIENPVPSKVFAIPPYTQTIQPYEYGHPYTKRTCLWLKNLPPLKPTDVVEQTATWCPSGSYSHKHGEKHKGVFTTDRAKNRAKTFPGIAKAMAEQWGDYLLREEQ